jgi:hypothetical protein
LLGEMQSYIPHIKLKPYLLAFYHTFNKTKTQEGAGERRRQNNVEFSGGEDELIKACL